MTLRIRVFAMLVCLGVPGVSAAEGEQPAAYDSDKAHGYLGLGLIAASSRYSQLFAPDTEASGGGLAVHGAAHSDKVNPSLDIAMTGQVALMSREFDGTNQEVGDFLYEIDGGMRISELFYVSLGGMSQTTANDTTDRADTYGVIPLGAGILHTTESGYILAQLRIGAGRLSNDQDDDTQSVRYGGLRAVWQHGFGSGVQFMLGLGLDRFHLGEYENDDFVRVEFGLGFGL